MPHLFIWIFCVGFPFGVCTRLGKLHYQTSQVVISAYMFTGIVLYIAAWYFAEQGSYSRVWAQDPRLGVAAALEMAVAMFIGKRCASFFYHSIMSKLTGPYARAQLDIYKAQRNGEGAPWVARCTVWVLRVVVLRTDKDPSQDKNEKLNPHGTDG